MALKLLNSAMNNGYWLMFQNCHLLLAFLNDLEKIMDRTNNIHPHFRLWLTTEATPFFPVSVLQRSLKSKLCIFLLYFEFYNLMIY